MYLVNKLPALLGLPPKFTVDVSSLLFANAINSGTIFLANILIARFCEHETFGVFSVAVNITMLTMTISEFGMNYSMIRLYKEHRNDARKERAILLAHLYFKLLMLMVLAGVGALASGVLAKLLLQDAGRGTIVAIALVSGGFLGFWSYFRAYFQILGRFRSIAGLTLLYAALRLLLLGGFMLLLPSPGPGILLLGVYVLPLIFVLFFGLRVLKKNCPLIPDDPAELLTAGVESICYAKWVAITGISFILLQQSLVYIVSSIGGLKQVALLNAGLVFTAVFSLINGTIYQVLYPKVTGYSIEQVSEFRIRITRFAPIFAFGSVIIIIILSLFMLLVLGDKYRESQTIFWITGIGTAMTAYIGFYSITMHTIKRPEIGAYVNVASLVIFSTVGVLLMRYTGLYAVVLVYVAILVTGEFTKAALIGRYIPVAGSNSV